jgi:hypothetical protein
MSTTQAALGGLTNTQLRATAVPISAAALPLPTGAATAALQTQPGVDIGDVTVNNGAGAAAVNIQDGGNSITVDGTVGISGSVAVTGPLTDAQLRASAVPVSLASTTITGTVTAAGNKSNNAAAPGATNLGVLGSLANAATPAWTEGNQVVNSVDLSGRQRTRGTHSNNGAAPSSDLQASLTAIATAAAPAYTEGNIVLHSVDLSGAQRTIGVKTNNTAAPSTQLGVMPARANAAVPAWTEGNQVLLSTTLSGLLRTEDTPNRSTTSTNTSVARNAASVTLLASNTGRKGGTIYNDAAANLFIIFGATATTAAFTARLQNTDYYEIPFNYTGVISGIWASAGAGNALMSELT